MADVKNENETASNKPSIRKKFINEFRGNRIEIPVQLESREIQIMYRRFFDGMSRAIALMRFYARLSGIQNAEDRLCKEVNEIITKALDQIETKNNIASRLVKENDLKITSGYTNTNNVYIIDPLANKFLQLIVKADETLKNINGLWLGLYLNDQQLNQANAELTKEIRNVTIKTRELSFGIRNKVKAISTQTDDKISPEVMEDNDVNNVAIKKEAAVADEVT